MEPASAVEDESSLSAKGFLNDGKNNAIEGAQGRIQRWTLGRVLLVFFMWKAF